MDLLWVLYCQGIKVQDKLKRTESIHRWKMNPYGPFFIFVLISSTLSVAEKPAEAVPVNLRRADCLLHPV